MRVHEFALTYVFIIALVCVPSASGVSETPVCGQLPPRLFSCPAPVLSNISEFVDDEWTTNAYNKSWDIHWYAEYNESSDSLNDCGQDINPLNLFNRSCDWELKCNQPGETNGSVVFYNFTVDLSVPVIQAGTNVMINLTMYRVDKDKSAIRVLSLEAPVPGTKTAGGYNFVHARPEGYILTTNWTETAFVNATVYTTDGLDHTILSNLDDIGITFHMHFECDQFEAPPPEPSRTLSCPVTPAVRNLTCPAPVLSNITQEPFVNGSWSINKYNKSWDIEWYAEYNKTIDSMGHCGNDTNPMNFFTRECNWTLECNIPNVTNGSVVFYNLTVDLSTPVFRVDTTVFMDVSFVRDMNNTNIPPETMFSIINAPVMGFKVVNEAHNYVFPSKSKGLIPNVALGDGYILTANWRERAYVLAKFYTNNRSDEFAQRYLNDIGITLNMHFECDQFFVNVTVYEDPEILGLALGIPFALIGLILLAAFLKYKYPNMCDCCKKKKDGNEDFDNDEAILAAARARREGRDLSKPMLEIQDKAGMQTWLDQAEDVVEDLNKNCLYLEEAKSDAQMNKGFDALERASGNPALGAHKDGFIGGRQLYAAGAASGGVKVVDHRPTMQTKGGGGDDDIVL